jgi:DNA-binding response OmpR family regulator/HPt (histidine-containing phosphotransfer) domain-containing protein
MSKKILVIEDEETLGKAIQVFLNEYNFNVVCISEGVTDIEGIRNEMPDLILTDLLMPGLHGFDICKSVKEDSQLKDIPLIIMTAVYKNAIHKLEAKRLGVIDFVEKPLNFEELLNKIRKALGQEVVVVEDVPAPSPPPPPPKVPDTMPEEDEVLSGDDFAFSPAPSESLSEEDEPIVSAPPKKEEPAAAEKDEEEKDTAILKHFRQLKNEYAAKLPSKITDMEGTWEHVMNRKDTTRQLAKLRRLVHSLVGSGTTFGFKEISDDARELELTLDMIIAEGENTIDERKDKITLLLDSMRHHPMVSTELELLRQAVKF